MPAAAPMHLGEVLVAAPERQTTTSSASRSSVRASACELSSAGMIPSVSASRWNAASASSSVHGR